MMEKTVYHTPYMSVIIKKREDVICTSADTDIPFELDGMGNDIFNTQIRKENEKEKNYYIKYNGTGINFNSWFDVN